MLLELKARNLKHSNRCQSSAIRRDQYFQFAMVIIKIPTIFLSFYMVPDFLLTTVKMISTIFTKALQGSC